MQCREYVNDAAVAVVTTGMRHREVVLFLLGV